MTKGIKEKDIRDFEKYAMKLRDVLARIRKYKPEANAFLACDMQTYLYLIADDHCDFDQTERDDLIVAEVNMAGFDGGGW